MASLGDLSRIGKEIMGALVEAEMLGLGGVASYLSTAFDELVREATKLRMAVAKVEAEKLLAESGEGVHGG